jgi:hypothetical protein
VTRTGQDTRAKRRIKNDADMDRTWAAGPDKIRRKINQGKTKRPDHTKLNRIRPNQIRADQTNRPGQTRQDKIRQTKQDKTRQDKTRQRKTSHQKKRNGKSNDLFLAS